MEELKKTLLFKEITVTCKKCKNEITVKASEEEFKFVVNENIIIYCVNCNYNNIVKIKE